MKAPVFGSGALDLIGNTPLVRLRRLCPNPEVEIWAKLESVNPGGSIKDRVARSMIEAAEAAGELSRDKIILEATSGNTGIGLALVGGVKGYKVLLAMSEGSARSAAGSCRRWAPGFSRPRPGSARTVPSRRSIV